MLKVGLFGSGSTVDLHAEAIKNTPGLQLSGFFNTSNSAKSNGQNFLSANKEFIELFENSDIIDIVSSDIPLFQFVSFAIKAGKHIFIENPQLSEISEIETLLNLEQEAHVKVQIGFTERYNPAFQAALPYLLNPMFIESHRMIPYSSTQPDISMISDIMVHDIDIILSVVKANIKRVHASGVRVFGNYPDIVNAHLEFDNGATANLTSNRISSKGVLYSKFYQPHSRVQVDFLKLSTQVLKQEKDKFAVNDIMVIPKNKTEVALRGFQKAIVQNSEPLVSLDDSYHALKIAEMIMDKIHVVKKAV
ncbi:MAG: Gfo/Idh/MocA family oxidoreductase [Bacteroidales bacterium]|nr:Gfo/Idh/MocA family oxidoreductase [Bacteroidales bacterium]